MRRVRIIFLQFRTCQVFCKHQWRMTTICFAVPIHIYKFLNFVILLLCSVGLFVCNTCMPTLEFVYSRSPGNFEQLFLYIFQYPLVEASGLSLFRITHLYSVMELNYQFIYINGYLTFVCCVFQFHVFFKSPFAFPKSAEENLQ